MCLLACHSVQAAGHISCSTAQTNLQIRAEWCYTENSHGPHIQPEPLDQCGKHGAVFQLLTDLLGPDQILLSHSTAQTDTPAWTSAPRPSISFSTPLSGRPDMLNSRSHASCTTSLATHFLDGVHVRTVGHINFKSSAPETTLLIPKHHGINILLVDTLRRRSSLL